MQAAKASRPATCVEGNVVAQHKSPLPGKLSPLAAAIASTLLLVGGAHAQSTTLKPVTVEERAAAPTADITGFGDAPLSEVPISATVIGRRQIEAAGARRLADLTSFDPSVTDAYNAPGYWDFLSIRGFTLDNRFNYRREGLPISAQTVIPLDNKERIEILKGTSGIQAGTSAPGGLVNYVVKRPTQQDVREVRLRCVPAAVTRRDHVGRARRSCAARTQCSLLAAVLQHARRFCRSRRDARASRCA